MSETLKIKLSIADRVYPLNIEPSQEEGLRKASKKIEDLIKKFEKSYAVRDKQDVLAMCALQFASEKEIQKIDDSEENKQALARLAKLEEKLSKLL
jgi:cell division protein ZapA